MSIMEYNGSGIVAMTGKNCVAIASDTRFGIQLQTVAKDFQRIHPIHPLLYVGLPGLITDSQTVLNKLRFRANIYALREERAIRPQTFGNMCSAMLYEKRFGPYFVEPLIAGLDRTTGPNGEDVYTPYITAMDLIGAGVETRDFVVGGTSSQELYGVCEAMYRPDMEPEDLFETISQCLMAAVDRDCIAGWGAVVHIITPDHVISRNLKTRQD